VRPAHVALNGNRTSASTYPADAAGACSTSTTALRSTAPVFDAADRMIASGVAAGTAYDAWGRITTLPAGLTSTPVAGDADASYYANDLVRSVSQLVLDAEGAPTTTSGVRTWTLDPAGRLATMTSTGLGATALTNHYSDPTGDSPTWTVDTAADGTVTTRRYLSGPAGYLGEATTTAGSTTTSIGLAGLHGDILRTTTPAATGSPDGPGLDVDEFGLITNPDTATTGTGPRYGWLGQHQRATDTGSTGLTLMGVRLYTPALGRFLSTDPVYGGNTTTYGYPTDPIGSLDLDGLKCGGGALCGGAMAMGRSGLSAVRNFATRAGQINYNVKAAAGQRLASINRGNRILRMTERGQHEYDVAGRGHYVKGVGNVKTPHKTFRPFNPRNPRSGLAHGKEVQGPDPMTWFDMARAAAQLFRR
jgi:RHS repeat-associated protein